MARTRRMGVEGGISQGLNRGHDRAAILQAAQTKAAFLDLSR